MTKRIMPYYEQQLCPPWVIPLLAGGGLAGIIAVGVASRSDLQDGLPVAAAIILVLVIVSNLLVMRTRVDSGYLVVAFGWMFSLYRRRIRLSEIETAEAVAYSPLREYGGWGIRGSGRANALNMRGNRGVQLVLRSGERLLIGSAEPEELLDAIRAGD